MPPARLEELREYYIVLRGANGEEAFLAAISERPVGLTLGGRYPKDPEKLRELGLLRPMKDWVVFFVGPEKAKSMAWRSLYGTADERTVRFLHSVLQSCGVLNPEEVDGDEVSAIVEANRVHSYQAFGAPHAITGLDADGRLVIEFWHGAGGDRPGCIRLRLKCWPTEKEVADIELALDLLTGFRLGKLPPGVPLLEVREGSALAGHETGEAGA